MRDKLKPGDIGFARSHNNWLSSAISWFMGSKWSHCFLVLDPDEDRIYISETSSFEVWINYLEMYDKDPNAEYVIYSPRVGDADRKKIVEEAMKNHGQTYGYLQLVSLGIRALLRKMNIKIGNFIRTGLVCCHHVLYGYTHTDIKGFKGIDPESIDTEETYQLVMQNLNRFEKVAEKEYKGG